MSPSSLFPSLPRRFSRSRFGYLIVSVVVLTSLRLLLTTTTSRDEAIDGDDDAGDQGIYKRVSGYRFARPWAAAGGKSKTTIEIPDSFRDETKDEEVEVVELESTGVYTLNDDNTAEPEPETERPSSEQEVFQSTSWRDPLRGHHFAIYDTNPFHDEVHGSVLYTLLQFPDTHISLYKSNWRWGFQHVIEDFWGLDKLEETYDPGSTLPGVRHLEQDILVRKTDTEGNQGKGMITDIFFTTCDVDFFSQNLQMILLKEWEERDLEDRFRIICMRHWSNEHFTRGTWLWLIKNALTFLSLGDHVKSVISTEILSISHLQSFHSHNPPSSSTFIPIFPPSDSSPSSLAQYNPALGIIPGEERDEELERKRMSRMIDSAGIQGNLGEDHRAMNKTLTELFGYIEANPFEWGYSPPTPSNPKYTPLPFSPSNPLPFTLHLVGSFFPIDYPQESEFENVIFKYEQIDYQLFFKVLRDVDVILTAFHEESVYLIDKASSTVGVAATVRTPIMSNPEMSKAYGFFCPSLTIDRPKGISEIDYIQLTRSGAIEWDRSERNEELKIKCQEDWKVENGKMLVDVLTREMYTGFESWEEKNSIKEDL